MPSHGDVGARVCVFELSWMVGKVGEKNWGFVRFGREQKWNLRGLTAVSRNGTLLLFVLSLSVMNRKCLLEAVLALLIRK